MRVFWRMVLIYFLLGGMVMTLPGCGEEAIPKILDGMRPFFPRVEFIRQQQANIWQFHTHVHGVSEKLVSEVFSDFRANYFAEMNRQDELAQLAMSLSGPKMILISFDEYTVLWNVRADSSEIVPTSQIN